MNAVGYYNFKNITDLLKTIGEKHLQINSYSIGDLKQVGYYTEQRLKQDNTDDNLGAHFPLVYTVPMGASSDGRRMLYDFNIICMDILNTKNMDNEVDVWNDTLQILKDILSQLKYSLDECYENWDVVYDVNFTPFSERFDEYVSGWNMTIRLNIPDAIDRCDAPFDNFGPCIEYPS